jgi:hypothetical protein
LSDCINYRYSGPAPPQALAVCDHLRISSDVPFLCSEAAMQQIREKIDLIDLTEDTIDVEEQAIEAQLLALKKIPGLGSCIDIELTLVRIGFFFSNHYPSRSGRKGCTPLPRVPLRLWDHIPPLRRRGTCLLFLLVPQLLVSLLAGWVRGQSDNETETVIAKEQETHPPQPPGPPATTAANTQTLPRCIIPTAHRVQLRDRRPPRTRTRCRRLRVSCLPQQGGSSTSSARIRRLPYRPCGLITTRTA